MTEQETLIQKRILEVFPPKMLLELYGEGSTLKYDIRNKELTLYCAYGRYIPVYVVFYDSVREVLQELYVTHMEYTVYADSYTLNFDYASHKRTTGKLDDYNPLAVVEEHAATLEELLTPLAEANPALADKFFKEYGDKLDRQEYVKLKQALMRK